MTDKREFYDAAKAATVYTLTSLEISVRGIGHQMRTSIQADTNRNQDTDIQELLNRLDFSERAASKK